MNRKRPEEGAFSYTAISMKLFLELVSYCFPIHHIPPGCYIIIAFIFIVQIIRMLPDIKA